VQTFFSKTDDSQFVIKHRDLYTELHDLTVKVFFSTITYVLVETKINCFTIRIFRMRVFNANHHRNEYSRNYYSDIIE